MKKIPILKNFTDYKDLYKGERCFVLGNGPSLNDTNLDLLKDEYTFAINQINLIYKKTDWRPSVYGSFSSRFGDVKWRNNIMESVNLNIPIFMVEGMPIEDYTDRRDILYVKAIGNATCNPNDDSQWSNDASITTTKYGTTLMSLIQIAIYMGFNPIYLIGCDLGYGGQTPDHFEKGYLGHLGENYNTWIGNSHKLMKRMCDREGIEIWNASIGGYIETYPRVKYSHLF